MSEQFSELSEELIRFIERQKIFFVGTAAPAGRVNVSPKGQDSLRVLGPSQILWMNLTGSGNETAAHLLDINRITLMWCAFEGPPMILRAYGTAETVHRPHPRYEALAELIPPTTGTRQYYLVDVDLVQTSCGYAVPFFDFREDRVALAKWAAKRGDEGIAAYWAEKNQLSLDGNPTGVLEP
jgi:hypothetical protein